MKLFEEIRDLGGSIKTVIEKIFEIYFKDYKITNEELDNIVDNLSLTDMLNLNQAYENKDRHEIAQVLNIRLEETVFSQGRNPVSRATTRQMNIMQTPKVSKQMPPPQKKPEQPKNQNINIRQYSDGSQRSQPNNNEPENEPENQQGNDDNVIDFLATLKKRAGISDQ